MTKKELKKSKSVEELKSPNNQEIKELKTQIKALLEQITRIKKETNQSIKFESQKAQNYLAQITNLTAELDSKEQEIKELTSQKNELTDQNNELRINNLSETEYLIKYQQESQLTQQLKLQVAKLKKDLTINQQDLKSAQRIIELRTIEPNKQSEGTSWDYWSWIRIGLLIWLVYLFFTSKKNL